MVLVAKIEHVRMIDSKLRVDILLLQMTRETLEAIACISDYKDDIIVLALSQAQIETIRYIQFFMYQIIHQ